MSNGQCSWIGLGVLKKFFFIIKSIKYNQRSPIMSISHVIYMKTYDD